MTKIDPQLSGYLDDKGLISRLPGKKQKKKLDLMIAFWASKFTEGQTYSEPEVNEILNQHHSFKDPATLRRLLLGTDYLDRNIDGTSYWKKIRTN